MFIYEDNSPFDSLEAYWKFYGCGIIQQKVFVACIDNGYSEGVGSSDTKH